MMMHTSAFIVSITNLNDLKTNLFAAKTHTGTRKHTRIWVNEIMDKCGTIYDGCVYHNPPLALCVAFSF